MKSQGHLMPVIPTAGPLAGHALTRFIARSSVFRFCAPKTPARPVSIAKTNGQEAQSKFGGDWLYAEDEYFPFDADSFEER
jgi:hypothetical protein